MHAEAGVIPPVAHLRYPSEGCWKSSSTYWSTKPAFLDMTTAQHVWKWAIDVMYQPSFHFSLIHWIGNDFDTCESVATLTSYTSCEAQG